MEAAAPLSRWIGNRLVLYSVQAVEAPSSMGMGDETQAIYDANLNGAHNPQNAAPAVEPAPTPAPTPPPAAAPDPLQPTLKGLTTSSIDMRPAVLYRITMADGALYKFGE